MNGSGMFNAILFIYLPLMLGTLLWNGVACWLVFRNRQHDCQRFRSLHYLVLLLMLPGMVLDVGGMEPDAAFMLWAAWLYPGVFFLAALANSGVLRRDSFRWWLLPVPLFNLWFGVVYLTRYLAYLGVPLGVALETAQVAYAYAQSVTVNFLYIFFPIANLWPVLLLPNSSARKRTRFLNVVPATICLLILGLNLVFLPRGWQIAASWRQTVPIASRPQDFAEFRGGVVLRVGSDPFPSADDFQGEVAQIQDLGVRAVNLFLHDDLMIHPSNAATLGHFIDELRKTDVTVILTADFPETWFARPPAGREEVLAVMGRFHQFLATQYHPDILVPFIEPYGASWWRTRHLLRARVGRAIGYGNRGYSQH